MLLNSLRLSFLIAGFFFAAPHAWAEWVERDLIAHEIIAPYSLGEATDIDGTWQLLNGSGLMEGYVIETEV